MKIRKIYPLLLPFIVLLSSCGIGILNVSSGYDANPIFTPHHEKQGELKAGVGYGGMLGIHGNVSYALTDRLTVMAGGVYNHQIAKELGIFNPIYFKLKSHYFEGALGYSFPLNGRAVTQVEVYAGFGSGIINKKNNFDRNFSESHYGVSGDFVKPFLLVTAKKLAAANFEISYVNRVSYLNFQQLRYYDKFLNDPLVIFNKAKVIVMEPVYIMNYGKRLKATGQVGLSIPLSKGLESKGESYVNASAIFQLGIKYHIR